MEASEIGKRITYYRGLKALTTTALAYKAGLSQSHLRDIELGKKIPSVETMSYICDALDISMSEFFDDSSEKKFSDDPLVRELYRLTRFQREALLMMMRSMRDDK